MDLVSSLLAVIAPVFLVTAAGYAWGLKGYAFDHLVITRLVTLLGAPAMVFSTFTTMALPSAEMVRMSVATLACVLLFVAVGMPLLKVCKLSYKVYLPSLIFPNIGNMGLPVCLLAFGQRGLALAMIYFAITTLLQFTVGPAIAAGQASWSAPFRVPFIYAVAAALAVSAFGVAVPSWLANTASLFAGMTIPLMLLSLGVALAELRAPSMGRALGLSLVRLGMGAAVGWIVAVALGLDAAERGVVIVESSMPVAVFNFLFARIYNNRPDEVAGLVLVSTLLSYASLPVIVALIM